MGHGNDLQVLLFFIFLLALVLRRSDPIEHFAGVGVAFATRLFLASPVKSRIISQCHTWRSPIGSCVLPATE